MGLHWFCRTELGRCTVEADSAVVVDVRVEHLGQEPDLGRLGGILLREFQDHLEKPALPGGAFGALDEGGPSKEVPLLGRGVDAFVLLVLHLLEVSDQSLLGGSGHSWY